MGSSCSGSLIATNFALTASHCVSLRNHPGWEVTSIAMLVGTVDRSQSGGITIQMAEFWWMQQPSLLTDDIALIRTATPVPEGNPNIGYIRIPSRAQTNDPFHGPVVC